MFKKTLLASGTFCVNWELVPGRGALEQQQQSLLESARHAAAGGRVHAIGVTDNPGGAPAMSAEFICAELQRSGVEP